MNCCRAQVLQFLEKQRKQPLLPPINPHMLPRKGGISCRDCKWGCKAPLCCEHSATWALSGCSWILSLITQAYREGESGWQQAEHCYRALQTDSCLFTCLGHICWNATATYPCKNLTAQHLAGFSSLNITLIRYREINLCDKNSGHTDDAMLWLLGNKTPHYHLSCCWEPSILPFSGGHNGKWI